MEPSNKTTEPLGTNHLEQTTWNEPLGPNQLERAAWLNY